MERWGGNKHFNASFFHFAHSPKEMNRIGWDRLVYYITVYRPTSLGVVLVRYFQHAHFIPIVGVGKERRILIGPW